MGPTLLIGLRSQVSTAEIAAAIARNGQLRVPRQPLWLEGLVLVPLADGVLVNGAAERQVLRGPGATTLLPLLVPLLDGGRTIAQIAAALADVPASAVENAIALLHTRGLLEEGAAADPLWTTAVPDLAAFFHRHLDVTRVHRSGGEALTALRAFRTLLVGEAEPAKLLGEELERCGASRFAVLDRVPQAFSERPDLVVVLTLGEESRAEMRTLDDECVRLGVPWLRTALTGSEAEIGPRFERGETACYRCFESIHCWPGSPSQPTVARMHAWISLVATELVMLASRIGEPASGHFMLEFDFESWSLVQVRPPRQPGCPACRSGRKAAAGYGAAAAYEHGVVTPSKRFVSPKAQQLHHRAVHRDLRRIPARYTNLQVEPLPPDETHEAHRRSLGVASASRAGAPAPIDRALLARLLRRAAGLRPGKASADGARRWAPSAGNLGSVQAYVVVREVRELASGLYYYDAARDSLVRLCRRESAAALMRLTDGIDAGATAFDRAAAVFVLTAAMGRLSAKYGPLAYRLAHLDAGVALAQLQAVAEDARLLSTSAELWDDATIREELGLDVYAEPITAILAVQSLGRPGGDPPCP